MRTDRAHRRGFTLIELMIVLGVIAIVAAIAIPNLMAARMRANETAAVSILRSVTTSQAQFQRAARADEDGDGEGEFGFLGELAGKVGARQGPAKAPTNLSSAMGEVDARGEVNRHGYMFRMYLATPGGTGRREAALGGIAPGVLDADTGEVHWVIYAWPATFGHSGSRTFFVNQKGDIQQTEDGGHTGADTSAIEAGSALLTTNTSLMTGPAAIGTRAADGNLWRPVQ